MAHRQSARRLRLLFFIVLCLVLLLWYCWLLWQKRNQPGTQNNQVTPVSRIPVETTGPPTHAAPQEEMASLIAVKNTKTLLISAYLEHRTGKKEVRVLAVMQRTETAAYRCRLNCQDNQHISEGISSIHSDHFGFAYGTADIMCPIPSGCETPSNITVTSAADKSEDKPPDSLEVKNQKAETKSFPFNFTVCISTMYNFTNVLQFVQSLEMLQLLGVNRVVIYKTNCSPEMQRVLDYYTQKGLVEVIPWSMSKFLNVSHHAYPQRGPGQLHYYGQIPALNDCVYRYMYQSRYVALHDIDELILPQTVDSWLELLPRLEKKYGVDKCYIFENNLFPSNVALPPPSPNQTLPPQDHWKKVPGLNILAHLYQIPTDKTRFNFKVIVSPRAVFTTSVHGLLTSQHGCAWVDRGMARMYHIRANTQTQLKPAQLIYDSRLLNYGARLISAVDTVLGKSGLLPANTTH